MEGDGEQCELVSCKMVKQLLWSFMWKPRRAVPLGVTWLQSHSLLQKTLKAELLAVAFAANLFDFIFTMLGVGHQEKTLFLAADSYCYIEHLELDDLIISMALFPTYNCIWSDSCML